MFYVLMFEFMLLGVIGGLLGIFYRNCLKVEDMIFHWWYVILKGWVKKSRGYCDEEGYHEPNAFYKILGFVAYPIGFCIYCSTFWITMLLLLLYLTSWDVLPKWQDIVIGIIAAEGVAHLIVCISCRFLIHKHPDLDKDYLKHLHE